GRQRWRAWGRGPERQAGSAACPRIRRLWAPGGRSAREFAWQAWPKLGTVKAVALTDEQAWTLTAAGRIALADGVLKGAEARRILGLVDERLEPAEQDAWIDRLADARALWEHAVALPRLPAERAPQVLHDAWAIALVDGEGSTEEVQVLE